MNKDWAFVAVFIVLLVSGTCDASALHHLRELTANETKNVSVSHQVSPIPSSDIKPNTDFLKAGHLDTGKNNKTGSSNGTLSADPVGSKKNETVKDDSSSLLPASEKNATGVIENVKEPNHIDAKNSQNSSTKTDKFASNSTATVMDDMGSCNSSLTDCSDQGLYACIETLREIGSEQFFLVVKNRNEKIMKVKVRFSAHMIDAIPELEIAAGKARKMNISSKIADSSTVVLTSGNSKCVLQLARPDSAFSVMQQISLHYIQATPIFAVYAAGVLVLVLGGILACCMIRRRKKQNEIPYQELEMGLPESSTSVPVNPTEGWDDDWDNDDWNEDNAVRSPFAQSRPSANGITSRSSAKEGWETRWED